MSELQQPSSRSGERVHVSAGRGASATPNGLLQDGADATHTAAAPVAAASAELEEWVTLRADPDPDDTAPFAGAVECKVPRAEIEFDLHPQHSGPHVVDLNAQKVAFYRRPLPAPRLRIWVLTKKKEWLKIGYVLRRLYQEGRQRNVQVEFKTTHLFKLIVARSAEQAIVYDGAPERLPDCVVPRVGAAVDSYGLAVIRHLEMLGALVLNPATAIEVCRDKFATMQFMMRLGVPVPKSLYLHFPLAPDQVEKELAYPMILKKVSGAQGNGVVKVESREQLVDVAEMLDEEKGFLLQEFVHSSRGRDLRLIVAGERVLASMMRINDKSFKANVHQGGHGSIVPIPLHLERAAIGVARACGLRIAGIDFLIDHDSYRVCEINSSPGFHGLENATKRNIAAAMLDFIEEEIKTRTQTLQRPELRLLPVADEHRTAASAV